MNKLNPTDITVNPPSNRHLNSIRDIVNSHFDKVNPDRLNNVSPKALPELQGTTINKMIGAFVTNSGEPNPAMIPSMNNFIDAAEQRFAIMEKEILSDPNLDTEENKGFFGTIKSIFGLVKSWVKGEYTPPLGQIVQALFCIALLVINPLPTVIDDFFLLQSAVKNISEVIEDYEDWQSSQKA